MRLTPEECSAIIGAVTFFDPEAAVYLFGSRVDDRKRGGDIDLLVESMHITQDKLYLVEEELFRHMDEQKVDIVLTRPGSPTAFARMVLAQGVFTLWDGKKNSSI
jgi:predicted nucleotidyltransferase